MDTAGNDYLKSALESLLFISEKPVTVDQMKEVLKELTPAQIKELIEQLKKEYQDSGRGMVIVEIAGGYQMLSNPSYVTHVRNFFKTRVKEKLSRPSLETLAIVAYKQPVSRLDIEVIRAVNSDGVVAHLLSKDLIKIVGRKDVPGRPYLYGTTKIFLEYFGLRSLEDLPKLDDISTLVSSREEVPVAAAEETAAAPVAQNTVVPDEEALAVPGGQEGPQEILHEVAQDSFQRQQEEPAVEEAVHLKEVMEEMNKNENSSLPDERREQES